MLDVYMQYMVAVGSSAAIINYIHFVLELSIFNEHYQICLQTLLLGGTFLAMSKCNSPSVNLCLSLYTYAFIYYSVLQGELEKAVWIIPQIYSIFICSIGLINLLSYINDTLFKQLELRYSSSDN